MLIDSKEQGAEIMPFALLNLHIMDICDILRCIIIWDNNAYNTIMEKYK